MHQPACAPSRPTVAYYPFPASLQGQCIAAPQLKGLVPGLASRTLVYCKEKDLG